MVSIRYVKRCYKGVTKVLHDESNGMNKGTDKGMNMSYIECRYGANFENYRSWISRRLVRDEMQDV